MLRVNTHTGTMTTALSQGESTGPEAASEYRETFFDTIPYPYEGVAVPDGPEDVRPSDGALCYMLNEATPERPRATEGDLIPNIKAAWDYIAHYHLGDSPGRKEPTTGEINYRTIFKFLHEKGYQGVLGMEHGKSKGGKEGEVALLEAPPQIVVIARSTHPAVDAGRLLAPLGGGGHATAAAARVRGRGSVEIAEELLVGVREALGAGWTAAALATPYLHTCPADASEAASR